MIAKTIQPGIYRSMPDAEYRALPALSNSDLSAWAIPRDISDRAAVMGSAFHAAILEPDEARERIIGLEPRAKRKDHPLYESPDHWILTNGDYKKLVGMVESVQQHPSLSKLRDMARADRDRCELVVVWMDEATGVLCKAKIDQVTDNAVWDWKTTQSDPDSFAKSIGAYAYHVQAAHYLIGAKACGLELDRFRFACVSKRADMGYPCWIQDIDEAWMLAGIKTRAMLLSLYARYGQEQANEDQ